MTVCHALLLKCRDVAADGDLVGQAREYARALDLGECSLYLGCAPIEAELYAYVDLAVPCEIDEAQRNAFERLARSLPRLAGLRSLDRLARTFAPRASAAGAHSPFRYVVETDPAEGWELELVRWYDTEHMPGLAAVPGCVRAQRYANLDGGPLSHACYDIAHPDTTRSAAWLAVRATAWSDQVRTQFRNTKRTMFQWLDGTPVRCP